MDSDKKTSRSAMSAEEREKAKAAAKRKSARKKEQKKRRRALVLSAVFLAASIGLLVWAIRMLMKKPGPVVNPGTDVNNPVQTAVAENVFPAGTTLNGVDIGKMTNEEALAAVSEKLAPSLSGATVTLESQELGTVTLTGEDVGLHYETEDALGSLKNGGNGTIVPVIDRTAASAALETVNARLSNHATNAALTVEYKTYKISGTEYKQPRFVYTEGQKGMQLNYGMILDEMETAFRSGNMTPVITPEVTVSDPAVTVADLKKQTTLLSQYSTTYYFKGTGSTTAADLENRMARDANISKAAGLMNCIVLQPKESFSFNTATGKRDLERGWTNAKAIYNGGYRPEPGGGVCQVSTTMYNALVRAGVTVTSHSPHTIPSDYVPKGWDATVDYGHIDFKFKNNKSGPLYVFVYIKQNSNRKKDIVVEVYGPEEPGVSYQTRDELVETDYAVNPITKNDKNQTVEYSEVTRAAHDGYVINTYVDKYVNGVFAETTMSYTAEYKKIEQITTVGTKPTPSPAPTKTPKPTATPKSEEAYSGY